MTAFFVPGRPVQQGSMKAVGNRVFHNSDAKLRVWRESIGWCARAAKVTLIPKETAVALELDFIFERPKSVARAFPIVPPDLDKLIRSCLDALTGIGYVDDCQVIKISSTKIYGKTPGVRISINPLTSL